MVKSKKLIVFMPSIEDGGVEKNLFLILNYLSKKLDTIYLITFNKKHKNKFNPNIKILTPFFNPEIIKGRYLKYFFCLLVLFQKTIFNKNYLVLSFQANIFVIIFCKIFGLKVLSRSNSSSQGWSKNKLKQFIFKLFFKKADKIIVNSFEFKKEMDKRYGIESQCILNPFDFRKIKRLSKQKVKNFYNKKKIRLITIGRLTDQKDIITIFKAINELFDINLELIVIGKGETENELKKYIYSNFLEKKIKLIGYTKNPYPYLRNAQILILSSKFEGSPNVLVEALFFRKYIISTNCPTGPKEILANGKFGDLVKIGDYKKIDQLIRAYSKKKSRKINNMNIAHLNKFNYKSNCKEYFNLISNFL